MLRSEHILKGLGNQYYRATYKSMGFTTEDLKRPLIGIANAWSECVPGHYNLRQVAQRVKDGIYRAGGTPIEFGVIGGCEETTTGIHRLKAMDRAGELRFPMVMVNEADCKHMFDNRYGTGQSVWDGIMRTTNLIVAGKYVVVSGYGWCGKGVSLRAKGLGAKVIVTETDPVRALEAVMDGYEVMPMRDAAKIGDMFVTVTGCSGIITAEHFETMKDGAILTNAGHFDVEVDMAGLEKLAVEKYDARHNIQGYVLPNGKTLFTIAEGRLVNLAAGDGHPAEIMDMSFAIQALSAEYLAANRGSLKPGVIPVPRELDEAVARRKLSSMGVEIDSLSREQADYLGVEV